MSILAAVPQADPFGPAVPAILLAVSASGAALAGVFRRRSVAGPDRLDPREPLQPLAVTAGVALLAWIVGSLVVAQAYLARHPHAAAQTTTAQTTTTQAAAPHTAAETLPPAVLIGADLFARAALVGTALGLTFVFRRRFVRVGVTPRQLFPGLWRGVVGVVIVLPLMFVTLLVTDQLLKILHFEGDHVHDLLKLLGTSDSRWVKGMIVFAAVAAAPISEELFFRGLLQTLLVGCFNRWHGRAAALTPSSAFPVGGFTFAPDSLASSPAASAVWTRWAAIVVTSLLFAAVHPWWSALPIFVLSLCLGYAYERTGNLWTPIAIHALFNTTEVIIYLATYR